MNLEDVMNFMHMHSPAISYDGSRVAYSAAPDRGDGYGVIVSSDKKTEYTIERGENPRFSSGGDWVLFTRKPPFSESMDKPDSDKPEDDAVIVSTADGSQSIYKNVKNTSFSRLKNYLFVHHGSVEDSTLNKEQNDKLKKAGTDLFVKDLESMKHTSVPFVDSWTVDSLSTTLVFTVKDTLESNNGLYYLSLDDILKPAIAIDTAKKVKFSSFTWFEKESELAYMRAEDMEKDTAETAVLYTWEKNRIFPDPLLNQEDAPEAYFLPFDNMLTWSNDGLRLFFGFRPERFAEKPEKKKTFKSPVDSLKHQADIDVWHGEDPLIKTHEKNIWNSTKSQNLISVLHLNDKRLVILADEDVTDVQPSKNGEYAMAWTNVPYRKRITWEGRFRDLYAININSGDRILVAEELNDIASLSPGAEYLLYFANNHWYAYDISKGSTENLTDTLCVPFFDETNDLPSSPSSYRIAGWMEDGESVLIYDRYDIWQANLRTGNMRNVTAGEGRKNRTAFRIRKMDDEPLFQSREVVFIEGFNDDTRVRAVYSARLDRQGADLVADEGKNLRLRLMSGDKKSILYTRESYNEYPDLWHTGTRFRDPVRLSSLTDQIEQFNWGKAELLSFLSADGEPLQGVVIKPGDYDPSMKYPVFVYYYEKFSQRLHDFNQTVINHRPSFGYYASNGYVVFLPDIHFIEGRPGMSAVKSLVPAVQELIDKGIADPGAIGLHGHSWSGYQTAFVVTQTDKFKAAIAGAPVSNMTSAYGGIRWGSGMARQFQYETGQSRLGSSIFEKRYLYIENSPLFYAHEINTPMLIMHGDADEAVPWEQSIELYLAMRRAGKDIIFLQYRDEPHHPQKYPNKVDYTIRMKEYFDYHLRGYEPAEWITGGVPYTGR